MNYDFYADENDIARILDYIFSDTDLILYELASKYGQEIKFYRETAEVLKNNNFSPPSWVASFRSPHPSSPPLGFCLSYVWASMGFNQ